MRFSALLLGIISLVSSPFLTAAIYADEAYTNDFHLALLGTPQAHTTFFHRPSAASKASLLYTLSEKLVVGAVHPKDGSIVWRQRLGAGNYSTGGGFLRAGGDGTVISAANDEVHVWNAADGRLVWQWKGAGPVRGLEVDERDGNSGIIVLSEEEESKALIRKLAASNGAVLWEHVGGSGDKPRGLSSSSDKVYSITLHSALLKGYKIKATAYDLATGKQGSQHTLSSDNEVTSEDNILHISSLASSPLVVWTDEAFKVLKASLLGNKNIASIRLEMAHDSNGAIRKVYVHAPHTAGAPAHFLVHYQTANTHWAEVYHVELSTGAITLAYTLPEVAGLGAFSASVEGSKVYFTRHTEAEITLLSSTTSATSAVLHTWPVRSKSHGGLADGQGVLHAASEVIAKEGSSFAVRSALALSSGDWELIRNGESSWIRTESIAGAVAAVWVDTAAGDGLAQELAAEAHGGILNIYIHRLRRHVRDIIRYLPAWVESIPSRIMGTISSDPSASAKLVIHRDGFGFDKTILVATQHGRVIALDCGSNGKVLWNIKAVNKLPHEQWHVLGMEVQDGTALIRGQAGEFLRLKALTGEILQYQPGGLISTLKTSASVLATSGSRVSIPVHSDGSVQDVPKSQLENGTVIVTQSDDGIVRGWSISLDAKPNLAWQFIPGAGEEVAIVTSAPSHDPVASIGKALGDRNVLYKYLNPNLLAISTRDHVHSSVRIYLLDSVSGETVYSASHDGVDTKQPLPLAIAENWMAYSLFMSSASNGAETSIKEGTVPKGYQLIVSELFESSIPNYRGPLGYSLNSSSLHPSGSAGDDATVSPFVISQAYLLRGPISKITTTSTLLAITPHSLICILPNLNAVISIPRSLTDPRRPVSRDPTTAELEEGLFRHNAQLDFEPKWILTHKREVMGLTDVITTPTLLESTSLVFAYGELDVFGTRVAPIGAFDMLGKGFSRSQLLATVVGLAILTGALAPMIRKKQIDALWTT